MRRRGLLGLVAGASLPAGCTGGPGDPITSLAVNRDETAHTVSVRVVRDGRAVIENTVTVDTNGVAELGTTPWRRGRYRVIADVDRAERRSTGSPPATDDGRTLDRTFRSDDHFNQLDVVVDADGAIELRRGRAA